MLFRLLIALIVLYSFETLAQDNLQPDFNALLKVNHLDTKYPTINGTTVDGKVISDTKLLGDIVVINIWA